MPGRDEAAVAPLCRKVFRPSPKRVPQTICAHCKLVTAFRAALLAAGIGAIVVSLLACPGTALAQLSSASVTGLVRDASGAAVSHAQITLANVDTNAARRTISQRTGNYSLVDVAPGRYTLDFSAPSFATEHVDVFDLAVNQTLTLEGRLQVGEVSTAIDVQAQGAGVELSTAELGTVIGQKAVNLSIERPAQDHQAGWNTVIG
jgi:hypothetical protein